MCARYTVFTEEEVVEIRAIIAEVSRKFGDDAVCKGEIRPTNVAPVLVMDSGGITPCPVSWGFPKWNGKGVDINARTDTILTALDNPERRSIWREPILTRRCVIPSTGFFEWTYPAILEPQTSLYSVDQKSNPKEQKTKLLFKLPEESMLYMAGIMSTFTDKSGTTKDAFVILTTEANLSMSPFHDRMPVILSASEQEDWIIDESFMRTVLKRSSLELVWRVAS